MRLNPASLTALFALAASASPAAAQESLSEYLLPDYFAVSPVALPDSLVESYRGGSFRLMVDRRADSEDARRLLRRAESLFPPREALDGDLVDRLRSRPGPGWASRFEEVDTTSGPRWWWDSFDRILTPYALTGPAVAYYIDRLRELAAGPNPFAEHVRTDRHSGEMAYRARVRCRADGAACVVRMRLDWRYDCGSLCAIWFTEERSVTFDAAGEVTDVDGDGPPLYTVS